MDSSKRRVFRTHDAIRGLQVGRLAGVAPHREASEARSGTMVPDARLEICLWVARPKSPDSALARVSRDVSAKYSVEMLPLRT